MNFAWRLGVKVGLVLFSLACLLILSSSPAMACTSFAVYGQEPVYGMNFDWYLPTEMKFIVTHKSISGNFESFSLLFDYEGSDSVSTVMCNGIFYSNQEQRPAPEGKSDYRELDVGEYYISQIIHEAMQTQIVLQAQGYDIGVPAIIAQYQEKKFVQTTPHGCHILVADPQGNAAIFELVDEGNEIVPIAGDFIVMTNFPNSAFKDGPYNQVSGTGAERYITAYEYIEQNLDSFDIDHAFRALKQTTQSFTRCSLVCDPLKNNVYLALNNDFKHIWRISISDKTVETWRGFDKDIKLTIPSGGITDADLMAAVVKTKRPELYWKLAIAAGAAAVMTVILIIFGPNLIWKLKLQIWKRM